MPISTRGLGMATNATQNLAQFMAALGAQQAQGIRGLGDTARQIQQDAERRRLAEAAQGQRQQQTDMQQAQMLNAQMADSRQRRMQEEQRAAQLQHVQSLLPQGQQLPVNMPTSALDAMMANLHAQKMQDSRQGFQGQQGDKDRNLSRFLAELRELGMDTRLGVQLRHNESMQDTRLGHSASEGQKDRDSSLQRVKLGLFNTMAENERGRRARAAENAKDRGLRRDLAASGPPPRDYMAEIRERFRLQEEADRKKGIQRSRTEKMKILARLIETMTTEGLEEDETGDLDLKSLTKEFNDLMKGGGTDSGPAPTDMTDEEIQAEIDRRRSGR